MIKGIFDVLFKLCFLACLVFYLYTHTSFKNGKFQAVGTYEINCGPLCAIVNTKTGHARMLGSPNPEAPDGLMLSEDF